MIARLIAWSARNLLVVFFGTTFAAAAGLYALAHLPLDAIPDLSDTQVIVYTEYPGQAPQVIEDQVTYPLTTAMLTVPRSKVVRGFSFFGVSFVYVIFEDGTDIYWARSRVLEFLNSAASRLPVGVTPTIGPDATGVGWVYQYAVMSKELNLSDTRAIQDWNLKFALARAEGVAEVASVGNTISCSIRSGCAISASPCRRCATQSAPAMPMSAAAPSNCPNSNMSSAARAI
jgi:Cu(I)/Ag(I) efflux system membrane protein CusA/SilA